MPDELPELTPAETERVRRLLAEARHTDPVPDDVAARLDRTLATLAEDRRAQQVVSLASRRRRRATQLLVAAAAVVVVGIGVGQVVSGMGSGNDMSTADSAGSGADQPAEDAPADTQGEAAAPESGKASDGDAEDQSAPNSLYKSTLPRVDDATFDADAEAARTALQSNSAADRAYDDTCNRSAWGDGERVQVRYQGSVAALVFRPAADGSQVVDLFACDADDVLRTGVVAAP